MTVGCQRAYFQLLGGLTAGEPSGSRAAVRAFVLRFVEDPSTQGDNFDGLEASGIVSVSVGGGFPADPSVSAPWYTLNGRRLDGKPTRSGIHIVGGKKVCVEK